MPRLAGTTYQPTSISYGSGGRGPRIRDALFLVEPGELEALLEIDALARDLGREEDEVVGVEVAADVGFGQQAAGASRRAAARSDPSRCSGADRSSRADPR